MEAAAERADKGDVEGEGAGLVLGDYSTRRHQGVLGGQHLEIGRKTPA